MKLIYNDIFLEHHTGNHPENKDRLANFSDIPQTDIQDATKYLGVVHNGQYIDDVQQKCAQNIPLGSDTVCAEKSFGTAVKAVGATIMASETGDFALVRPPGHHAFRGRASGFCIFNNIAIAATKLVEEGKKVLIFDFDGHFGDGTSSIFYESDKVMFWSIHQCPAFPGTGTSCNIGEGKGQGYNINVELPPQSGDDILMDAFNTFLPFAKEFNPDIVGVSAGFDGHKSDMLLDLNYSLDSFFEIGRLLNKNFSNIFAVLEGGYNPDILSKGIENFLSGINGLPKKHTERLSDSTYFVHRQYENRSTELILKLRPFWKSI